MKSNPLWQTARVAAFTDLTPTVREFTLLPVDGRAIAWPPGAHLQVRLAVAGRDPVSVGRIRKDSLINLRSGISPSPCRLGLLVCI